MKNEYALFLSGLREEYQNPPQTSGAPNKIGGSLQVGQLAKFFPNQDPSQFRMALNAALQGKPLNPRQKMILGDAFIQLLRSDPNETMKIMQLVKKVSEEPAEG